jgi:hypothetical protein
MNHRRKHNVINGCRILKTKIIKEEEVEIWMESNL